MPELIPASPAEPWDASADGANGSAAEPPRVPLLPLDPGEADETVRLLCSAGVPPECVMGARHRQKVTCEVVRLPTDGCHLHQLSCSLSTILRIAPVSHVWQRPGMCSKLQSIH